MGPRRSRVNCDDKLRLELIRFLVALDNLELSRRLVLLVHDRVETLLLHHLIPPLLGKGPARHIFERVTLKHD